MKKNAKRLLITGMLMGCVTVAGTGLVALADGNAYQNFKTAAMNTAKTENMTVQSVMSIEKNGEVIASGIRTSQKNGSTIYSYGAITAEGKTLNTESMRNDTELVHGVDGKYTKISIDETGFSRRGERSLADSPNRKKMMEMVTDVMAGDVKNYFSGGQDHVSVSLEGAQVPELLNTAVAAMNERSGHTKRVDSRRFKNFELMHGEFADLENLQIKAISMDSDIDNGLLNNTDAAITFTYTNDDGQQEELTLRMHSDISQVGSTSSGSIDLTGKEVEEITR